MFIDWCVTVVGDRLVTAKWKEIVVRLVHTGQVVHTIHIPIHNQTTCITPVPGHSELIVTGHLNGDVHLWDIGKGARACECMNVNAGVHVRQIVQLAKRKQQRVDFIVASSTRLMCSYDNKTVEIVHLGDKKSETKKKKK